MITPEEKALRLVVATQIADSLAPLHDAQVSKATLAAACASTAAFLTAQERGHPLAKAIELAQEMLFSDILPDIHSAHYKAN